VGDAVAELLDRAMAAAPDRFRGVRQMTFSHPSAELSRLLPVRFPEGILASDAFQQGFRHVASRGLSFDATVFHNQLPEVCNLADRFPNTTIVLDHLGMAMGYGLNADGRMAVFQEWRKLLADLARRPNAVCKIGGLGMPFWGLSFEKSDRPTSSIELANAWRPYVEVAIEVFGPERCLMGSNYPIEASACGYVPLWNALKYIVKDYSPAEKAALFHDVAARVYRIDAECE
jgi:predicted TIM-barrel fold metal-dependent hydrolase